MNMRKRFTTLVGVLMVLSLFTTGFATTITLYPPTLQNYTPQGAVTGPTIAENHKIGPDYFGILWNKSGDDILGLKFSYDAIEDNVNDPQYTFRNTKLSAQITVKNSTRTTREPKHYNSDCLVIQTTISGGVSSWTGVTNFGVPNAATVGVSDGTVFEKVPVSVSGDTLTMRIPIAMIYRLAAAQKGAASTNNSTLAVWLEFEDNGVASEDVVKICGEDTTISFKMATAYYYQE